MITLEALHDEIAEDTDSSQADNPEYEAVVVINFDQGIDEQRMSITEMRWDHKAHQFCLITD